MQPQQQTVVTNAGPVQPVYISQPYQTASVVNSYRRRQSTIIGILLIIAGCLSIIFNIVDIAVGDSWISRYYYGNRYNYRYSYYTSLSYYSNGVSGHGIWCGIMIIIAGGFGIGAGRHKTRCMINTFLVFAIIGATFGGIQAIVGSTGANSVFYRYINYGYSYWQAPTVFSMAILLAILGACAFGLCLWGSILCCATGGCCAPQPVAFTMMPVGQPQVTIVSQQQQHQQQQPMQPVVMAQPPAYQPAGVYPTSPQYPGYDVKYS